MLVLEVIPEPDTNQPSTLEEAAMTHESANYRRACGKTAVTLEDHHRCSQSYFDR
jgi:hypothetical protein